MICVKRPFLAVETSDEFIISVNGNYEDRKAVFTNGPFVITDRPVMFKKGRRCEYYIGFG